MRQVVVRGGQVVVAEVPEPVLEPGTLLVDVEASCISTGTELSGIASASAPLWRKAARNPAKVKAALRMASVRGPRETMSLVRQQVGTATPVGYSAAGTVRAVANDVEGFRPGDEVACAGAGVANHASVARVPVNLAVHLPAGVSPRQASTVALGAIALQGVRRASVSLGETVVVVGLGAIGQITVQLLKAAGCRVLASDIDSARAALAVAHGAEGLLPPEGALHDAEIALLTGGIGADAVIITAASPSNEIISRAFQVCRKKARVVVVGDVGLGLKRGDLYAKELDVLISTSYGPGRYDKSYEDEGLDYPVGYVRWTENRNMEEFLRLLAEGRVDVSALVSKVFQAEDAPAAYAALASQTERPLSAVLQFSARDRGQPARSAALSAGGRPHRAAQGPKLTVALVGAGSFARTMHLPNLRALSQLYDLRWVVSRSGLAASELARQNGVARSSADLEDALADGSLDAVLIATNHDSHCEMALRCLEAGKHVFVEKPLAISAEELVALEHFFELRGDGGSPVLMTGFNRRFSEHAKRVAGLVAARREPMMVSYRANAGWLAPESWVYGPKGGGRNIGEACHMYDLFGFWANAKQVWASASSIGPLSAGFHRDDNFFATLGFGDGSVASLAYTSLGTSSYPKERCEVFFDGKVVVLDDFRATVLNDVRGATTIAEGADKGHRAELEAFARAALDGGEWPIPLWQQLQATSIAFQVQELLRSGQQTPSANL